MKKKTLSTLNVNLLTIDDLYSLIKITCEKTIIVSSLYYDNLYKLYVDMRSNNEMMCILAGIPSRSELTDQLNEMNMARIACIDELKREIDFNLIHSSRSGRIAARALHRFFEPYWNTSSEKTNIQSEIYHDLLTKYLDSPDVLGNVTEMGLDMLLSNLESTNSRYDMLMKARMMEIEIRELSGKDMKPLVVKNYIDFCQAVEDIVNFAISDDIIFLFNKIDEVRKTYPILIETVTEKKAGFI